jgi:hypothetical protein
MLNWGMLAAALTARAVAAEAEAGATQPQLLEHHAPDSHVVNGVSRAPVLLSLLMSCVKRLLCM